MVRFGQIFFLNRSIFREKNDGGILQFFWGVGGVIKVRFLPKIAILRYESTSRGHMRPRLGELGPDIIMGDH